MSVVKDTLAYCIGRVCELHPEAVVGQAYTNNLLEVGILSLDCCVPYSWYFGPRLSSGVLRFGIEFYIIVLLFTTLIFVTSFFLSCWPVWLDLKITSKMSKCYWVPFDIICLVFKFRS